MLKIRRARPEEIPQLMMLWIECFGDTSEYINFVFDKLILPENAFVLGHDNEIYAMLFYSPFELKGSVNTAKGAYIYGVATSKTQRGQGFSTQLLEHTNDVLAGEGYELSVLVPASKSLFDFYSQRGYSVFSEIANITLRAENFDRVPTETTLGEALPKDMYALREKYFSALSGFVSWSREYLEFIYSECNMLGGDTLLLEHGDAKGYAVCYKYEKRVYIKEFALPSGLFNSAAAAIHKKYKAEEYIYRFCPQLCPQNSHAVLPYSMIKWYHRNNISCYNEGNYITFTLD